MSLLSKRGPGGWSPGEDKRAHAPQQAVPQPHLKMRTLRLREAALLGSARPSSTFSPWLADLSPSRAGGGGDRTAPSAPSNPVGQAEAVQPRRVPLGQRHMG